MTVLAAIDDIYIKKGDTGNVLFDGLPQDKMYNVFLSIYDVENNKILKEIQGTYTQSTGVALFLFSKAISDTLPVGEWGYGLKVSESGVNGMEDTLVPRAYVDDDGALIIESMPKFIVDNKFVEGGA